jgi:hypothetical protein
MNDLFSRRIRVRKEHRCVGCGATYRYLLRECLIRGVATRDEAKIKGRALLAKFANESHMRPCPECGRYQPDMIAARRWAQHLVVFANAVILFLVVILFWALGAGTHNEASWCLFAIAGLAALANLVVDLLNPNFRLKANRKRAQKLEDDRKLWLVRSGEGDSTEPAGNGFTGKTVLAYLLFAASILLFLLPVALPGVAGWPVNPEWYPPVAGPGDSPYIYFPKRISSISGRWNGAPRLTVRNTDDPPSPGSPI